METVASWHGEVNYKRYQSLGVVGRLVGLGSTDSQLPLRADPRARAIAPSPSLSPSSPPSVSSSSSPMLAVSILLASFHPFPLSLSSATTLLPLPPLSTLRPRVSDGSRQFNAPGARYNPRALILPYRTPQNEGESARDTGDDPSADADSTQDNSGDIEIAAPCARRAAVVRPPLVLASLTYAHVRACPHTTHAAAAHVPLSRQYRKLKDWPMIARRAVAFFPLGGEQPPQVAGRGVGNRPLLSENCGFTCERLPNATR